MAGVQSYVVHNTFVELADSELMTGSSSIPVFRRRRGSSFFRCSSEPLSSSRCAEGLQDTCSTEDGGSTCDRSSPQVSPSSSRATSPEPASSEFWQQAAPGSSMSEEKAWQPHFRTSESPQLMGTFPMIGFQSGQTVLMPALQSLHSCNTSMSLSQPQAATTPESQSACHLIWCDHRAFKDSSSQLKQQLEVRAGAVVKTHKTADNCIRLFRKKQRAQGRPPCVILVSWTNAPGLLQYLRDAGAHVNAKVVVLCDARSCRKGDSVDDFSASHPNLRSVATSWEEALESVCDAVAEFK